MRNTRNRKNRNVPMALATLLIATSCADVAAPPGAPVSNQGYPPQGQMQAAPQAHPIRDLFASTIAAVLQTATMGIAGGISGGIVNWFAAKIGQGGNTGYANAGYGAGQYPNSGYGTTAGAYGGTSGYPSTASTYPSSGYPSSGYPSSSYPSSTYPSTGSGYPESQSQYPSSGYPQSQSQYPSSSYPNTASSGYPSSSYPNTASSGYPSSSGQYPNSGYPSSGTYPDSGSYPNGASQQYPGTSQSPNSGYPTAGTSQYPNSGYPTAGTNPNSGYPSSGAYGSQYGGEMVAARDTGVYAGIAYEVHALSSDGHWTPIDPLSYQFRSGDRFMVYYRPSLPGRMQIYNVNPAGAQTLIDATDMAAGQLAGLGPYEFTALTGDESLRLVLSPCSTPQLLVATRDIVKADLPPPTNADTGGGVHLENCSVTATRGVDVRTRDIQKVAADGSTSFALDPVSPQELTTGNVESRQVTIVFHHR